MKQHTRTTPKRRSGFMSMELAMTLPILMLVLFAVFEYSLLFYARGTVVEASRLGARAASYPGTSYEYVEDSVLNRLGPALGRRALIESQLGEFSGDPVVVVVRVPMHDVAPDLLWPIGFGLRGRYLVAETVMQKE